MRGVTAAWASTLYGTSTTARACRMVGSAGSTRLDLGGEEQEYSQSQSISSLISTNCRMSSLMVLLQTTAHSIHTHDIIIIHAFFLLIERQMRGLFIFPLPQNHIFDSNSAASRALGFNSLLSRSFTLYYLTLQ